IIRNVCLAQKNAQFALGRAMNATSGNKRSKIDTPDSEGLIKMFCQGSSMSPTLKFADLLVVKPYNSETIRCGDVIVFNVPGQSLPVVHRVVRHEALGMRTRGDNNDSLDPDYLKPCDIIGQVLYRQKGTRLDRVHGGRLGTFTGAVLRLRRALDKRFSDILRPAYLRLANSGIFRRWPFHPMETRVIYFEKNG